MFSVSPVDAAIYRWDNGELLTDKDAEPGGYKNKDLKSLILRNNDLSG
jgi:hypothetical protein